MKAKTTLTPPANYNPLLQAVCGNQKILLLCIQKNCFYNFFLSQSVHQSTYSIPEKNHEKQTGSKWQ